MSKSLFLFRSFFTTAKIPLSQFYSNRLKYISMNKIFPVVSQPYCRDIPKLYLRQTPNLKMSKDREIKYRIQTVEKDLN